MIKDRKKTPLLIKQMAEQRKRIFKAGLLARLVHFENLITTKGTYFKK